MQGVAPSPQFQRGTCQPRSLPSQSHDDHLHEAKQRRTAESADGADRRQRWEGTTTSQQAYPHDWPSRIHSAAGLQLEPAQKQPGSFCQAAHAITRTFRNVPSTWAALAAKMGAQ